jgi:serine/threonine protein kinase
MFFDKKDMKFKPKNGGNNHDDEYIHQGLTNFDITKYEDYISYTNSSSFVGTAEYASPELLKNNITNAHSVDIWALGCILYKFFHGKTPFLANNDIQIFKNILNMNYEISKDLPDDVRDLISKLLVEDPEKRLGVSENGTEYDFEALKSHIFFKDILFEDIHMQDPPIDLEYSSPKNSNKNLDKFIATTSCMSNKYRSCDLSEINLNLSDNNISFFDSSDILIKSPNIIHRRHHSYNSIINLEMCDYSYDTYIDDCFLIEDYIKVKEDSFIKISVAHEKIVKKRGWIIYTVVKLRLLSNGRLETLDVYSNELLVCRKIFDYI